MLVLKRYLYSDEGVYGVLIWNHRPLCVTLEPPWRNNVKNKSCIPCGNYILSASSSANHPLCYRVADVPGRTGILIHAGNTLSDTKGCILVGESFSDSGLKNSKLALNHLHSLLPPVLTLKLY